jgi:hypothetical protein
VSARGTNGRRLAGFLLLALLAALFAGWSSLALWYQVEQARLVVVVAWLALVTVLVAISWSRWRLGVALLLAAALGFLAWWWNLEPRLDRDWAPEVSRLVTGEAGGNRVTLNDVRDFEWQSETAFTPRWTSQTYDLAALMSADVILSYWGIDAIAHTLVSFGFADGRHVVFSVEIRRETDEVFSSVAGFFKAYELALVASEERDILYLRTNVRKEDVYLYPLDLPPQALQALFLSYVEAGNTLAVAPRFYNTLTANCTTVVFDLARLIEPGIPLDWRILLSGYLPGYLVDQGILMWDVSEPEARRRAAISARAQAASPSATYSSVIRNGG